MRTVQFVLTNTDTLSLKNTLECGQSFRWKKLTDDSYISIVKGVPAYILNENGNIIIKTREYKNQDVKQFWADYFDLQTDYSAIIRSFRKEFSNHPFTTQALEYGKGLRILQQDTWEMLISYIISQRLSIPRISAIIEELAKLKGTKTSLNEFILYSFPAPEQVAELSASELRKIGLGYRTDYIIQAAENVLNNKIAFDNLYELSLNDAIAELMKIHGVGPKVANCVCLFGLGKPNAFPVDTWIAKADKYYDGKLNASLFGQYAGIAQEYIFHYIRHIERKR